MSNNDRKPTNPVPNVSNENLQSQIAHLQGNMEELQDVMADVQKQLLENFKKSSEAKHAVDNFQANFVAFKDLFERQNNKLNDIRDTLLASQYEKRISGLETFRDAMQNIPNSVGLVYSEVAILKNRSDESIKFQTTINAQIRIVMWLIGTSFLGLISTGIAVYNLFHVSK